MKMHLFITEKFSNLGHSQKARQETGNNIFNVPFQVKNSPPN